MGSRAIAAVTMEGGGGRNAYRSRSRGADQSGQHVGTKVYMRDARIVRFAFKD
jgi:hypothetical protein